MRADWTMRPLGDIFDIGAGKTMSAAARVGEHKVPFLRTSNVFWDQIDLTNLDEMAIPPHELVEKSLRRGDLLVCEGGEIGRAAIWNGSVEAISFQNHLHRLRPKYEDVEPRFYVYFLQSAFTQLGVFEGAGNRTTIPNLSSGRLAALEVPHPPIGEQRDIVRLLSHVRQAATVNEQLIEVGQELKQTSMQELFSRGLRGEPLRETELGPIPKGWTIVALGSLGRIGNGTTPNRRNPDYWTGGTTPWITSGRMYERRVTGSDECVTAAALRDLSLPVLQPGAVLIAIVGQGKTLGHCALLAVEATISRHVGYIQPGENSPVTPAYLRGFLESRYQLLRQLASGNGSTRGALTGGILRGLQVPLPPVDEQLEIVEILDAIDQKIDLHQRKREILRELFQSLLRLVMTGEIVVEDLDLAALGVRTGFAEAVA